MIILPSLIRHPHQQRAQATQPPPYPQVTTEESDNFFHFNDNRVLPEHVTAEIANAEGWWYKPDYIINGAPRRALSLACPPCIFLT